MKAANGLVHPRLSIGRFSFSVSDAEFLEVYTDEDLFQSTGVRIAFTGRQGGFSTGAYASLNLGSQVGDTYNTVLRNRYRLAAALGFEDYPLAVPRQIHGDHLTVLTEVTVPTAWIDDLNAGADGIIIEQVPVAALLCFADCASVIMVAPSGIFAVVHAGWRGVMASIAPVALTQLAARTQCLPADCNVYVGPHIRSECFEVSTELADRFVNRFGSASAPDSRHVSLIEALRTDLVEHGANSARIADCAVCTACHPDQFFSYRLQQGICGRHGAFAARRVLQPTDTNGSQADTSGLSALLSDYAC